MVVWKVQRSTSVHALLKPGGAHCSLRPGSKDAGSFWRSIRPEITTALVSPLLNQPLEETAFWPVYTEVAEVVFLFNNRGVLTQSF